jgi:tyrosyl-tRNA synthetase
MTQSPAFGLTWPLVTKADGTKFGKTESGAIWLTADRTSPYAYYQFWLNAADADVVRLLKTYTFLAREEIDRLEHSTQTNPGARDAQRALAQAATQILHGKAEMLAAEAAAKAVFSGDLASLPLTTLQEALASAPGSTRSKAKLEGAGETLLDLMLLPEVALAASKREAREFLQAGAVTINGRKATLEDCLKTSDLLHNTLIVLKRGKKNTHVLRYMS